MRRRSKIVLLLVVIAVIAAIIWIGVGIRDRARQSVKLRDGSTLKVEKVTFGKRGPFTLPGGGWRSFKSNVVAHLPKKFAARFPKSPTGGQTSWSYAVSANADRDALQIWFTRWLPSAGVYSGYQPFWAELIDDDGCIFPLTTAGGEIDAATRPAWGVAPTGGPTMTGVAVNWVTFEAFPRHQRQIRLRLFDTTRRYVTELIVPNPAFVARPANSKPAPQLPVTVASGDVKFTLASLGYRENYLPDTMDRTNGPPHGITPVFEANERGLSSKEWHALTVELQDGSGNLASTFSGKLDNPFDTLTLCPLEDEWRMSVQFVGTENSAAASNAVWKIPGVKIPEPGDLQKFDETRTLLGVSVNLTGIAGPGAVTYSNRIPYKSVTNNQKSADMTLMPTGQGQGQGQGILDQVVRTPSATLAIKLTGMNDKQRVSVRARDERGRDYYARQWQHGYRPEKKDDGEPHFFIQGDRYVPDCVILDLPDDAKIVDLTITLHTARTVEFKFKPPPR